MAYVTVKNIESETSYLERDWSLFVLKELEDNAFDWLNDYFFMRTRTLILFLFRATRIDQIEKTLDLFCVRIISEIIFRTRMILIG